MKLAEHLAKLRALLLVCTCTYTVTGTQPDDCTTLSTFKGLKNGTGKTGSFPNIQADPGGTVFIFDNL